MSDHVKQVTFFAHFSNDAQMLWVGAYANETNHVLMTELPKHDTFVYTCGTFFVLPCTHATTITILLEHINLMLDFLQIHFIELCQA